MCRVIFGLMRGEAQRRNTLQTPPPLPPRVSQLQAGLWGYSAKAQRPRCPRLTLGVTFTARSGCWRLLLLRHGPGRPVCDPVEPGSAGRPKPPLPWLDHRGAFLSRRRFAQRALQARAVSMFSSPTHCPGPPPPAVSPFTFCTGEAEKWS